MAAAVARIGAVAMASSRLAAGGCTAARGRDGGGRQLREEREGVRLGFTCWI
jgi:hypothetical protein